MSLTHVIEQRFPGRDTVPVRRKKRVPRQPSRNGWQPGRCWCDVRRTGYGLFRCLLVDAAGAEFVGDGYSGNAAYSRALEKMLAHAREQAQAAANETAAALPGR